MEQLLIQTVTVPLSLCSA